MKTNFINIFFILMTTLLFSQASEGKIDIYNPKVGDNAILMTRRFKPFCLREAKEFFKKQFFDNLRNKHIVQNTYFLESTNPNYMLVLSFVSLEKGKIDINSDNISKEYKSNALAVMSTMNFQVIAINDEKYSPNIGDKLILWDYYIKSSKVDEVVDHFKNVIYPLLAKDEYSRDSYLVIQKTINKFVGITFLSGKYKESKLVAEKLKEMYKYFEKTPKLKVYDIIGIYDSNLN